MKIRALVITIGLLPFGAAVPSAVAVPDAELFPDVESCDDSRLADFNASWFGAPGTLGLSRSKWVPQGMAYYPKRDWIVVSYYDSTNEQSSLIEISRRSDFARVKRLALPTNLIPRGGHVGGLAIGKGNLYVTNSVGNGANVFRFSMRSVEALGRGETMSAAATYRLAAASYASFHRGNLFVGSFDGNRLYRYDTDGSGNPPTDSSGRSIVAESWATPSKVQGLAVSNQHFVFSRSFGRRNLSALTVRDRRTGAERNEHARNMSEGITWAPANYPRRINVPSLYMVFESTSTAFDGTPGIPLDRTSCRSNRVWFTPRSSLL